MQASQQFSITLPSELAEAVRAKVRSGEYASESDVVLDGLQAIMGRDHAFEDWLTHEVGPAYDALKADPSRARSAAEVRATLSALASRNA